MWSIFINIPKMKILRIPLMTSTDVNFIQKCIALSSHLFHHTLPHHPPPPLCSPSPLSPVSGNFWKGRRHVSALGLTTPPPARCLATATSPVCIAALVWAERKRTRMMTTNISRAANPSKAPPSLMSPRRVTRSTQETWIPPTRKTKCLTTLTFILSSLCFLHYSLSFSKITQIPNPQRGSQREILLSTN